jgi:hypothetical protein
LGLLRVVVGLLFGGGDALFAVEIAWGRRRRVLVTTGAAGFAGA